MVALTCVALHPAIPAMDFGVSLGISRSRSGGLTIHLPGNAKILGCVIDALRAGALVPPTGSSPFWDEIEREIMATRDELLARADQLLSQNSAAHLRAS